MVERRAVWLWIGAGALALVMLGSGTAKLLQAETWAQNFENWGYPGWMHWVIGGVEVTFGALILWPRARPYAATVLAGDMAGAVVTHLANAEWTAWPFPLALGVIAGLIGWFDCPSWLRERLR